MFCKEKYHSHELTIQLRYKIGDSKISNDSDELKNRALPPSVSTLLQENPPSIYLCAVFPIPLVPCALKPILVRLTS